MPCLSYLTAPPCHRPRRVREVFRRFREVFGAKLCQNAFQTIPVNSIFGENKFCSTIFFRVGHCFSSFWASFGASTGKRTSPSTSPQFFALDAAIMRSVRPKIDEKLAVGACTGGGGRTLDDRGFRAVVGRGRGGELTLTHQTPRGRWIKKLSPWCYPGAAAAAGAAADAASAAA